MQSPPSNLQSLTGVLLRRLQSKVETRTVYAILGKDQDDSMDRDCCLMTYERLRGELVYLNTGTLWAW